VPMYYTCVNKFLKFYPTVKGLISHSTKGKRLSWRGWHGEILRWFVRPKIVAHPTLNTRLLSHLLACMLSDSYVNISLLIRAMLAEVQDLERSQMAKVTFCLKVIGVGAV